MPGAYWRKRTHCQNGHEFTEENTRIEGNRRSCRRCQAINELRNRARKSGNPNPELVVYRYLIKTQDRVPNKMLGEIYTQALERGISSTEVARRAGFMRKGTNTADVDRLYRSLGLRLTRCGDGRSIFLQTIRSDRAKVILDTIDEFMSHTCSCGEVVVDGETMCGFCIAEREEMDVAA